MTADLTDHAPSVDAITTGIGAGSVAFGVAALLAPGALSSAYGMKDTNGDFNYLARGWGSRTLSLGLMALFATPGEQRTQILQVAALMNGLDTLAAFGTRDLPGRTKLMAGLTSAGFCGAAVYALSQDS